MNIVWFKRDLRIEDHQPLLSASQSKLPCLCLHIIEPALWNQNDLSIRQYLFYIDCLKDLSLALKAHQINLCIKVGDTLEIFKALHAQTPITSIFSHQETWNNWTYQRDKTVRTWCRSQHINVKESLQIGVKRGLKNRDNWTYYWQQVIYKPKLPLLVPKNCIQLISDKQPKTTDLFNQACTIQHRQKGGRIEALKHLNSFFSFRGSNYSKEMSSPSTAFNACSRLSPFIAFGCISIKEIFIFTHQLSQSNAFKQRNNLATWKQSVRSFQTRLHWHCHFIQKLEDQPSIEFNHLHPAYNKITFADPQDLDRLERWQQGKTGFPFIDACIRALDAWGWLNFRMRAMLMSFAAHHLALQFRKPALFLAQQFIDYEPGIHYPQCQMQAGTTGINAIRIYNPIKQSQDQDPKGKFIKYWVKELRDCPVDFIHTPWEYRLSSLNYSAPIVNEKEARNEAAKRLYSLRKSSSFDREATNIIKKHASRKKPSISFKKQTFQQLSLLDN